MHYEKFGDDIPTELNFASYFKDISKAFNIEYKKQIIRNSQGIQLSSNEVKLKVLNNIENIFNT